MAYFICDYAYHVFNEIMQHLMCSFGGRNFTIQPYM